MVCRLPVHTMDVGTKTGTDYTLLRSGAHGVLDYVPHHVWAVHLHCLQDGVDPGVDLHLS